MTRGDLPGLRLFGRPFKPLAVGLLIGGFTLSVNTIMLFINGRSTIPIPGDINGDGILETASTSVASLIMGLFSALGLILMMLAWVRRNQPMYEWGLLFCFGAWTARWIGIALDGDLWYAMLPFAVSFMAAGAYWLERADEHDGMK